MVQASVLVLNAGSSSLKFALLDPRTGERHLDGIAERLGTPEAILTIHRGGDGRPAPLAGSNHRSAVAAVVEAVAALPAERQPVGIGHRIVHGGEEYAESTLIDGEVLAAVARFAALAPLHNPPGLLGVEAALAAWPDLPQVAVFDTAFHQTMPATAYRYAVPEAWYRDHGVRRYGFHGTSHRYVSRRAAELLGRAGDPDLALVVAHLGNGSSATAVLGGRSVDTTMGLTPLEGLVMGTRSGDVDPGLFGFLADQLGLDSTAVTAALNKESGLLGLSGISNDLRAIEAAATGGDDRALLALDVLVRRLAKAIAGLVVPLGHLDALVFTGGIGENSAMVRSRTVAALGFLGLALDPARNERHGKDSSGRIGTADGGGPEVLVVATDEELMIALDTIALAAPATPTDK